MHFGFLFVKDFFYQRGFFTPVLGVLSGKRGKSIHSYSILVLGRKSEDIYWQGRSIIFFFWVLLLGGWSQSLLNIYKQNLNLQDSGFILLYRNSVKLIKSFIVHIYVMHFNILVYGEKKLYLKFCIFFPSVFYFHMSKLLYDAERLCF